MDKIDRAREFFLKLESQKRSSTECALRNFEIQSRLSQIRK